MKSISLRTMLTASVVTLLSCGQYNSQRNELDLFEGDIILTDEQKQELFGGDGDITSYSAREGAKWPNGIIPYKIRSSDYSSRQKKDIKKAMKKFKDHTCVTFVPKKYYHKYYINIKHETNGCDSYVGRCMETKCISKGQKVNLANPRCFRKKLGT